MENKIVNIAFILDDGFVIPTATALTSLIKNKNFDTIYNIYLITNNLSKKNICYFKNLKFENVNIIMKNLKENFEDFKIFTKGFHVSNSAIIKFLLPSILNELDKCLYLDGDIIVQKDLLSLYNTDINDNYAGVIEDLRPKYRYVKTQLEKLKISHHRGYFNSGVMLLNLKKLRNEKISDELFNYRKFGFNTFMDQDTFNVVFKDNVVFLKLINNFLITLEKDFDILELNKYYKLDNKYNTIEEILKDSLIVHFSSKYKPWIYLNTAHENLWFSYFKITNIKNKKSRKRTNINIHHKIDNLVISLTSYPARVNDVEQTIKSLLNQTVQSKKIVLTLGEDKFPNKENDLPESLKSLLSDKFEILWTPTDLRSYTKLVPALKEYPNDIIVTADDDIVYKEDWLEKLYKSYKKNKNMIHCHRVHRIIFNDKCKIKPYKQWEWEICNVKPSFNNFLTGVGGVLYPPNSLYKDIFNIELFQKLAPFADDIWFWAMAVLNNTKINVIKKNNSKLEYVEDTQKDCLWQINVTGCKNDEQLLNVIGYYPQILKKLDKRKFKRPSELSLITRLFSITNLPSKDDKWYKVIYILGLKFSFRNKKKEEKMKLLIESENK